MLELQNTAVSLSVQVLAFDWTPGSKEFNVSEHHQMCPGTENNYPHLQAIQTNSNSSEWLTQAVEQVETFFERLTQAI